MAILWGGAGADTLTGGAEDNTIGGGGGNDRLTGNSARDQIFGGDGDDTITGGGGDDYLEGGAGRDTFVLRPGDGWDYIGDFQLGAGGDTLDLSAFTGIASRADLNRLVTQDGNDVVITFGPTSSVRLANVDYATFVNGQLNLTLATTQTPPPANSVFVETAELRLAEGNGGAVTDYAFTVTRTGDLSQAASVGWGTVGSYDRRGGTYGMATFADFAPGQPLVNGNVPGGVLTFAAGQASATIHVGVLGDNAVETAEGFRVYLTAPSAGWTIDPARAEGLGVILNDDAAAGGGTPGRTLTGTDARDELYGTAGDDTIVSGAGNDYMEGGAGSDRFVVRPGDGWDYVADFQAGAGGDVLDLTAWTGIHSLSDLTISSDADGTSVTFANDCGIRLANVAAGTLTAANILFAGQTGGNEPGGNEPGGGEPGGGQPGGGSGNPGGNPGGTPGTGTPGTGTPGTGTPAVTVAGTAGNDYLNGTAGNDVFAAGAGYDYMTGGGGTDVFVAKPGDSWDVIADFQAGAGGDRIDLSAVAGIHGMGDLTFSSDATGTSVVYGDGDGMRLEGVGAAALTAANFTFAERASGTLLAEAGWSMKAVDPGAVRLVDTAADGTQANSGANASSISPDGRYVVFSSASTNLVGGDTARHTDIFLKDLQTGSVTCLSTTAGGAFGNNSSRNPVFSRDGRYVAFTSDATNLATGPGRSTLLIKDIGSGQIWRADEDGPYRASFSADTWTTFRQNVHIYSHWSSPYDLFMTDLRTGTEIQIVGGDGSSNIHERSPDGRYLAYSFGSLSDPQPVHLRDLQTGTTVQVAAPGAQIAFAPDGRSLFIAGPAPGAEGTGSGGFRRLDLATMTETFIAAGADGELADAALNRLTLSANGRYLGFFSNATNLAEGSSGTGFFIKDLETGAVTRAPVSVPDPVLGDGAFTTTSTPSIADDGRSFVFDSSRNTLVKGDRYSGGDVFVGDIQAMAQNSRLAAPNLVELSLGLAAGQPGGRASIAWGDGQTGTRAIAAGDTSLSLSHSYAQRSDATGTLTVEAGDGTAETRSFAVRFGTTDAVRLVSEGSNTEAGASIDRSQALSADGRFVVFSSNAVVMADGQTRGGVFVRDTQTGTVVGASTAADGSWGDGTSYQGSLSADGRYVTFYSTASNLLPGNGVAGGNLYRKDLLTGAVLRVNSAADGSVVTPNTSPPVISGDGRYVAFNTPSGSGTQLHVKDLETGALVRADVDASGQGLLSSGRAVFSADGSRIAFSTYSGSAGIHLLAVKNLRTGALDLTANIADVTRPSLSADGRYVSFVSASSALVANDSNAAADLFVKDLETGTVTRVSTAADGTQANGSTLSGTLSADGRHVVFSSQATNLVPGEAPSGASLYAKDLDTGAIRRIDVLDTRENRAGIGSDYSISADGRLLAVTSAASLTVDDTSPYSDVFLVDTQAQGAVVTAAGGPGAADMNALFGTGLGDTLTGGGGADFLSGGVGDDLLDGAAGDDVLRGGAGNDTLSGGVGSDLFVFGLNSGLDVITDFNPLGDRLQIAEGQDWSVGANAAGNAVITFSPSDAVTLLGIRQDQVSANWFITG